MGTKWAMKRDTFVGSAGHTKLVADKGPRNYIPGAPPVIPNKNKAAETLPVNSTKPSTKRWANKKRGSSEVCTGSGAGVSFKVDSLVGQAEAFLRIVSEGPLDLIVAAHAK